MSRLYRALLPLAPKRLRALHGADMEELFAERLAASPRPSPSRGSWATRCSG